jgi:hypothetical protein
MIKPTGITNAQIEFSKLWVEDNPALFAKSVSDFLAEHDADAWELGARQTKGFFTLEAKLKVPSLAA